MTTDELKVALENICSRINEGTSNHGVLFIEGHGVLTEFMNNGGGKNAAYDILHGMYEKYYETNQAAEDLTTDWMDCITGYYGGKNLTDWQS